MGGTSSQWNNYFLQFFTCLDFCMNLANMNSLQALDDVMGLPESKWHTPVL